MPHPHPQRVCLNGLESDIFKLVSYSVTPEQWGKWLRLPLEHAAARGNVELVNILLEAGAYGRAGWRGCRGRSLMEAAALGGNPDVVSALVQAGAKRDVKTVSVSSRRSALYTAAVCGHEETARRLIFAGANVNFQDQMDKCGVLAKATQGGHDKLTNDLLQSGADFSRRDSIGRTPLHHAAFGGHNKICSLLLIAGADKDVRDYRHNPPLLLAAGRGHLPVVTTLLSAGAAFNVRGSYGYSALDLAARGGHVSIVEAILDYGAIIDDRDNMGITALHAASMSNQSSAVHALVDAGADIERKSNNGMSSLQHAAESNSYEAALALLERGAAADTRDTDYRFTPLHQTCSMHGTGVEKVVDLLLRWGADEGALDVDGCNASTLLGFSRGDGLGCSKEEVERTRALLTRAPVDRLWRRRGWVVMYRSRVEKAERAARLSSGVEPSKIMAPTESSCSAHHAEGGDGRSARSRMEEDFSVVGDGTGRADEGGEGWGAALGRLFKLEVEGVFRTVIGFL